VRRVLAALILACAVLAAPAAQQPPRLVVIVVVDQFRADYLNTFATHWRNGFRTVLAEGAVFRRAAYPYLHTDTCAGHFTISTGTLPHTHGMIADTWWDGEAERLIECTDDDASPNVTYGRASRLGKSGRRLLVPTIADQLREQQRGSRVVALSMKARGAIGLAGHGGDAITWFEETPGVGAFVTARAFAAAPVAPVKAFIDRDPYEKEFGRPWTLRDAPDAYRFADAGIGERPPAPWTGEFPHESRIEGAPAERRNPDQEMALWRSSPHSDAYLGRMAIALSDALALGRRDATDFLGISFSAIDFVGHAFGPESREVEDTVARLDDTLGALIAHLDGQVGRANYVLALSADHGVAPVPVTKGAGRVATEDIRERIDETLTTHFGRPPGGRYTLAWGDNITLAPGVMQRLRAEPAVMRALERAITTIPGIERVLRRDALSETSSDATVRAASLSAMDGRSGDLIIIPKPNWLLLGRNSTNASTHGTGNAYDQQVPLILFGAGIKAGRFDSAATPADIAPTLAKLAHVTLPKVEGRILAEALR
jgi:predicted AlkP superfamily pyrophosphatase or phosphodiesterase